MWELCKGKISFEEVEKSYADMMLQSFERMKFLNGNHRIVKRITYQIFKTAKRKCDAVGDYKMYVDAYDKNKPLTYHFETCPVAEFAREHGFTDILPALCNVDYPSMEMLHMKLIRKQTLGLADCCDYMIVGDKDSLVKEHPQYSDENGYIRNK